MKQLTGLDASFLYMETASSFGHVSSLSIYEPPDAPDFNAFEAFKARLEDRLPQLEPFRRRLVEVPFELDHPWWANDPDFDLDFHVRHQGLPAPGDDDQLANQVARIIGRPMDRTRPLWEVYVIDGLADGSFAVLTKVHHATIDGASGVEMMSILLDTEPDPPAKSAVVDDWKPDTIPSQFEMFARTMSNLATHPQRAMRVQFAALRRVGEITRNKGLVNVAQTLRRNLRARNGTANPDGPPALPSISAPATPFNKAITPHRRWAFRSAPLEDIKALKSHLDVTVNDVVMGICAGALRRYLQDHGALPDQPLQSMIPVSIRTGDEPDRWTNRVSGLVAALPTDLDDPLARVAAVNEAMSVAKETFELVPADVLVDLSQFSPPAVATRAARVASAMRIADRMNPPVNVVISNVPGPRQPLYMAGAKLRHYYPVSTVSDGIGLNITVMSYLDTLDFGLVSCRELVPDLWDLVDLCIEEIDVLYRAAGIPRPSAAAKRPARAAAAPTGNRPRRSGSGGARQGRRRAGTASA
jgi:diacylglycerol O-acyltransferase